MSSASGWVGIAARLWQIPAPTSSCLRVASSLTSTILSLAAGKHEIRAGQDAHASRQRQQEHPIDQSLKHAKRSFAARWVPPDPTGGASRYLTRTPRAGVLAEVTQGHAQGDQPRVISLSSCTVPVQLDTSTRRYLRRGGDGRLDRPSYVSRLDYSKSKDFVKASAILNSAAHKFSSHRKPLLPQPAARN